MNKPEPICFAGFCASKATTVFLIDQEGLPPEIIDLEIGDNRETNRHSPKMERMLTAKGLDNVEGRGLSLTHVTTDASKTIISLLGKFYFTGRPDAESSPIYLST